MRRAYQWRNALNTRAVDNELASLVPLQPLDRRGFIVTSLGAGFALAVLPVSAQTITTPADGLVAGEVKIPTADGSIPGYRAMPATGGNFPVILVVQEIFGVHEHIRDVVRRLAKLGYYAIAPELYARQGDVSKMTDIPAIVSTVVSKVSDAQVMGDLDAAVAFAKASGSADTTRLGVTGFCWGGRIVWMYAAHNPALKAAVAWYGPVVRSYAEGDKSALDVAAKIKAPVLGLYGGADGGIPNDTVDKMRAALKAAGNTQSEIVTYPDTPHGFYADYRPSYRKEQADEAWKRATAWFKQYLG
jgi:carboxymethylenebutenolidase